MPIGTYTYTIMTPSCFSSSTALAFKVMFWFRILLAITLPISIFLLSNVTLSHKNHNSGWSSAFIHPHYTLRHLREGWFFVESDSLTLGSIFINRNGGGFQKAFQGARGWFHLQPLLLILFKPLFYISDALALALALISSEENLDSKRVYTIILQEILFGILMNWVDFKVASSLFHLGDVVQKRFVKTITHPENYHAQKSKDQTVTSLPTNKIWESYESEIENHMEGRIRPQNGYIFGLPTLNQDSSCNLFTPPLYPWDEEETFNKEKNESNNTNKEEEDQQSLLQNQREKESNANSPSSSQEAIVSLSSFPQIIFFFYYCNPITIGSSTFFHSFYGVTHLLYVEALRQAYCCNISLATLHLAILCYMDDFIHPFVHLIPMILIFLSNKEQHPKYQKQSHGISQTILGSIFFFCLWTAFFIQISLFILEDSNHHSSHSWKTTLIHPFMHKLQHLDIQPSLSMVWYFYIQMFHRFRDFFVVLLNGISIIFVLPLSLRLWRYPLEMVCLSIRFINFEMRMYFFHLVSI